MSVVLRFSDNLDNLETTPVSLDLVVSAEADALTLEGLRVLALRREQSVGRDCLRLKEKATLENHIAWTERYLVSLQEYCTTLGQQLAARRGDFRGGFRWSSPLSSLPPSSRFALDSVLCEQIMAHFFYAGLLQEQAHELALAQLPAAPVSPIEPRRDSPERRPPSPAKRRWSYVEYTVEYTGSCGVEAGLAGQGVLRAVDAGEAYARVAALYRRAAGVFTHIATQLYPAAAEAVGTLPVDRPVELWEGAAEAMAAVSLAQAQTVAACRAEAKGTSTGVTAALHAGAAELFEAASKKLRGIKQASPELKRSLSDRLRRYLAVSATLSQARALRAVAQELRAQGELGQAVAALRVVIAAIRQAQVVCEKDGEWRFGLGQELGVLEALHAICDKERQLVYYQKVADSPPVLPVGKVVVKELPFELPAAPPGEG